MIATISKQAGRRYPQFGGPVLTGAWPLRLTGTTVTPTRLPAGTGWTVAQKPDVWVSPIVVDAWTSPVTIGGWTAPEDGMPEAPETVELGYREFVDKDFDFSLRREIAVGGQTIVSAEVTELDGPDGVDVNDIVIDDTGKIVTAELSAPSAKGRMYHLCCLATTNAGKVLELIGPAYVGKK